MRTSTSAIIRANGRPTLAGDHFQNEIDLDGSSSFFWVIVFHRVATGGTATIATCITNFTSAEEASTTDLVVNWKDQTGSAIQFQTTDGSDPSVPVPASDLANVGDIALRVVYGDTAAVHPFSDYPRYLNCTCRTVGNDICKASAGLLWPKNYIQNMKYIGRARTDTGGIANDDDSPYTQIDERLKPEVCVLQSDGTYYAESSL